MKKSVVTAAIIPMVLGIGVDGGVHLLASWRRHNGDLAVVFEETGLAVEEVRGQRDEMETTLSQARTELDRASQEVASQDGIEKGVEGLRVPPIEARIVT